MRRLIACVMILSICNIVVAEEKSIDYAASLSRTLLEFQKKMKDESIDVRKNALADILPKKEDLNILFPTHAAMIWDMIEPYQNLMMEKYVDEVAAEMIDGEWIKIETIDMRKDTEYRDEAVFKVIPENIPVFRVHAKSSGGSSGLSSFIFINNRWIHFRSFEFIPSLIKNYRILFCKTYNIFSSDGKTKLGRYIIQATLEAQQYINITDYLSMDNHGEEVAYRSIVEYENNLNYTPVFCFVETKISGDKCMDGSITFANDMFGYECTGYLNKITNEVMEPPQKLEKTDQNIPDGILIFQSALPAIGPRLLPKEGELKKVVFVEFPDDVGFPELFKFKENYRMVRGKPDENGEYEITIYKPQEGKAASSARYNKEDEIVSLNTFGKWKMVEVEK